MGRRFALPLRTQSKKTLPSYSYAKLPRTGLGNMLFVWARAFVFAHVNEIDLIVSRWGKLKVGPILRREKHLRLYFGYFRNPSTVKRLEQTFALAAYERIREPEVAKVSAPSQSRVYVFEKISRTSDYFEGIRNYRDDIRDALFSMLAPRHCEQLARQQAPVIGVHVRLGDFRKLAPGEKFGTYGHIRAPLSYYQELIEGIREISGTDLPVTIFSDGDAGELGDLLRMPKVALSRAQSDIVDLLTLSRSRFIITSPSSTFSYWSAFLSDSVVFHHPDHCDSAMRPSRADQIFEGAVTGPPEEWPSLLKDNIGTNWSSEAKGAFASA